MENVVPAVKAGRCYTAAHRDKGKVVHYVPAVNMNEYWTEKALCRTEPGLRSYGWDVSDKKVNCEKCLKKQK